MRVVFGLEHSAHTTRMRSLVSEILDSAPVVMLLPGVVDRLDTRWLRWLPGNPLRRFERQKAELDRLVLEAIGARRAQTDPGDDLLSLLLASVHEDGSPMSDLEIRDELLTMLVAGHETTSAAAAWTLERLAHHPGVEDRLARELAAGERSYLDAVIKETLRVRPVVFDAPRRLAHDIDLGGWRIPAGWYVVPALGLMQRDPQVYPDPATFDPSRFLGQRPAAGGFVPFGGGNRRCVGSRLAMLELEEIVAAAVTRRRISAPSARDERERFRTVTLVPARGARVRLHAR